MSHRDILKKRIKEMELEIANKQGHKEALEKELQNLIMQDFEEEMREDSHRKSLLQG